MRGIIYGVVTFNVGEEQLVFYSVTAVIIPMIELTLNFDKIPKTGAAFPAPRTFECNHFANEVLGGKEIKVYRNEMMGRF